MGYRLEVPQHRVEQAMNRPEDYEYLLALCRNEIPKAEATDLLVN